MQVCPHEQIANFSYYTLTDNTEASGFDPDSCVPVAGPTSVGTLSVDPDDTSTKTDSTGSSGVNGISAVIGFLATASAAALGMVM